MPPPPARASKKTVTVVSAAVVATVVSAAAAVWLLWYYNVIWPRYVCDEDNGVCVKNKSGAAGPKGSLTKKKCEALAACAPASAFRYVCSSSDGGGGGGCSRTLDANASTTYATEEECDAACGGGGDDGGGGGGGGGKKPYRILQSSSGAASCAPADAAADTGDDDDVYASIVACTIALQDLPYGCDVEKGCTRMKTGGTYGTDSTCGGSMCYNTYECEEKSDGCVAALNGTYATEKDCNKDGRCTHYKCDATKDKQCVADPAGPYSVASGKPCNWDNACTHYSCDDTKHCVEKSDGPYVGDATCGNKCERFGCVVDATDGSTSCKSVVNGPFAEFTCGGGCYKCNDDGMCVVATEGDGTFSTSKCDGGCYYCSPQGNCEKTKTHTAGTTYYASCGDAQCAPPAPTTLTSTCDSGVCRVSYDGSGQIEGGDCGGGCYYCGDGGMCQTASGDKSGLEDIQTFFSGPTCGSGCYACVAGVGGTSCTGVARGGSGTFTSASCNGTCVTTAEDRYILEVSDKLNTNMRFTATSGQPRPYGLILANLGSAQVPVDGGKTSIVVPLSGLVTFAIPPASGVSAGDPRLYDWMSGLVVAVDMDALQSSLGPNAWSFMSVPASTGAKFLRADMNGAIQAVNSCMLSGQPVGGTPIPAASTDVSENDPPLPGNKRAEYGTIVGQTMINFKLDSTSIGTARNIGLVGLFYIGTSLPYQIVAFKPTFTFA